jgi:hypothetical protein
MRKSLEKGFTVVEALVSLGVLTLVVGVVLTIYGDYFKTANRNYKAMSERVVLTQISSQLYSNINTYPVVLGKIYVSCFLKNATGTDILNPKTQQKEQGFIAVSSYNENSPSICSKDAEIEVHVTASPRSSPNSGTRYLIEVFQITSFESGGLMKKYTEEINVASGV